MKKGDRTTRRGLVPFISIEIGKVFSVLGEYKIEECMPFLVGFFLIEVAAFPSPSC